jgi:hypothetical protein
MLRFLLEVAIAIGLSILVATSPLGIESYVVIGSILATIAAVLIYSTHGLFKNIDSAPTPIWIALTLGICIVLGAMWPAMPFIFFYEREKTRRWRARHELITVVDGNAVIKPRDKT